MIPTQEDPASVSLWTRLGDMENGGGGGGGGDKRKQVNWSAVENRVTKSNRGGTASSPEAD